MSKFINLLPAIIKTLLSVGSAGIVFLVQLPLASYADDRMTIDSASQTGLEVPLRSSPGGTLYINASVAGIEDEFLLDTGAGMVTLSETLFAQLVQAQHIKHVRQMAARLANNRIKRIDVYRINDFSIGSCQLGSIDVAVMKGGSRNLLGLSALRLAAPFSIQLSPPTLALSNCGLNRLALVDS